MCTKKSPIKGGELLRDQELLFKPVAIFRVCLKLIFLLPYSSLTKIHFIMYQSPTIFVK